jgi:hypothetical protein
MLDVARMTCSKFFTEDTQILGNQSTKCICHRDLERENCVPLLYKE